MSDREKCDKAMEDIVAEEMAHVVKSNEYLKEFDMTDNVEVRNELLIKARIESAIARGLECAAKKIAYILEHEGSK